MICSLRKLTLAMLCSLVFVLLAVAAQAAQSGVVETPKPGTSQTGIGLISGWHCTAKVIQIQIDGGDLRTAGAHTSREDTIAACGHADTGFGLLFNYNLLAPGHHRLVVYGDGAVFGTDDFETTNLGTEFLTGKKGLYPLLNFPEVGQQADVGWSEETQNFAIVGVEKAPDIAGTYYGATVRRDCDEKTIVNTFYGAYTVELSDDQLTLTIEYTDGSGSVFKNKPTTLGPGGYLSARVSGDVYVAVNGQVLTGQSLDTPCGNITIRAAK